MLEIYEQYIIKTETKLYIIIRRKTYFKLVGYVFLWNSSQVYHRKIELVGVFNAHKLCDNGLQLFICFPVKDCSLMPFCYTKPKIHPYY